MAVRPMWRAGPAHPTAREVLLASALALACAAVLGAIGPPPEDAPAHLYRALLVREGAVVWDNLWYGGHHPVSYGILLPLLSAHLNLWALAAGGAVLSAACFAALCVRQFGAAASWPARVFGVLAAAPLFTGLLSYSLGLTCLLASLLAIQRGRALAGGVLGTLALAFSPLAFAFLCLALTGVLAARWAGGGDPRTILRVGAPVAAAAAAGVAVLLAFPNGGVHPYSGWDLLLVLAQCVTAAAVAWRAPAARILLGVFAVWGLVCVATFLIDSPIGSNIARLRGLSLPVTLLVVALAGFRPRWLAALAISLATASNLGPLVALIPDQVDQRPTTQGFWGGSIGFLSGHREVFRVEVVPTATHWEAYWLPRAGIPLARGWFRQMDPPWLLRDHFDRATYVAWLRARGVRFVVLPHTRLDPDGGPAEARLIRGGLPELEEVFRDPNVTIYEVREPVPILTGSPADRITEFGHDVIAGTIGGAGTHRLAVRHMPYWRVSQGAICLRRAPDGLTVIEARAGGPFRIVVDQAPRSLLSSSRRAGEARCGPR